MAAINSYDRDEHNRNALESFYRSLDYPGTDSENQAASVYATNGEIIKIRNIGTPVSEVQYNTSTNTINIMGADGVFAEIQIKTDIDNHPCDLIINGVPSNITSVTPEERRALTQNNMRYGTTPEDLRDIGI